MSPRKVIKTPLLQDVLLPTVFKYKSSRFRSTLHSQINTLGRFNSVNVIMALVANATGLLSGYSVSVLFVFEYVTYFVHD